MTPSRGLETRSVPGRFRRMVHRLALKDRLPLPGGIAAFADPPPVLQAATSRPEPAMGASR